MRKRDYRALRQYTRDIADLIELRDWTITLVATRPDTVRHIARNGEWGASSDSPPGRKSVTVTIDPRCREWDKNEVRQTIVHELVHAHFAPLVMTWRNDLDSHLSPIAYSLFNSGATRWLEYGVDAIADALAKHLPLIDWP